MINKELKEKYSEIFSSHGHSLLQTHIQKISELDEFLPVNSTFYCITNTQTLKFEYISKNMFSCIGIKKEELNAKGMEYLWSRMHPDDIELWLVAMKELMRFTLSEISEDDRVKMSYTWNYRLKQANGNYVNIIQNTTPIKFDELKKPIIGLAHYTVIGSHLTMDVCASAKFLNDKNEYETLYFNNFSQKLISKGLTNRQRDIIRLLVLNNSSKEIAEKLFISSNTVDTHRRNILKKLNISSTGELKGLIKSNVIYL